MSSKEEIKKKQNELREKVNTWLDDHPEFANSKTFETVKPHVSESTYKNMIYHLKYFSYFMDMLPDDMIAERNEQLKSEEIEVRNYYENKFTEFRNFMTAHHYTGNSVKNRLGKIAGFFTNNGLKLRLASTFWKKAASGSELVESFETHIRLIDNAEIRLILDQADPETGLATLLGCQNGMLPVDIVKLTYEKVGFKPDDNREFSWFKDKRSKTGEEHFIVLTPDSKHFLKLLWKENGKPSSGWIFEGHNNSHKHNKTISSNFKDVARIALGEKRGNQVTFKDLRDYYNSVLLTCDLPDQYKKVLFGHKPSGSEGSYEYSEADVMKNYIEKAFPKLSTDGWDSKVRASEMGQLNKKIDNLTEALTQVEKENITYKTRLNNLQKNYEKLAKNLDMINTLLENNPEVLTSEDYQYKTKKWAKESKKEN